MRKIDKAVSAVYRTKIVLDLPWKYDSFNNFLENHSDRYYFFAYLACQILTNNNITEQTLIFRFNS